MVATLLGKESILYNGDILLAGWHASDQGNTVNQLPGNVAI